MKSRISNIGKVLSCRAMGMNVKRKLYEGVAVPTALYGVETHFFSATAIYSSSRNIWRYGA